MLSVPIIGSDRVIGAILIENYEREHAFGEADVRLLSTVAASMGVALENARLFDETQRLLKETEQRNAELAVINSIQQGLAAELDFQAIIDLVGDKLREVFDTEDIGDHAGTTNARTSSTTCTSTSTASGFRCRRWAAPGGVYETSAEDPQPRSSSARGRATGLSAWRYSGHRPSKSFLSVPIFSGDRFLGMSASRTTSASTRSANPTCGS